MSTIDSQQQQHQPQHSMVSKAQRRSSLPRNEVILELERIDPQSFDLTGEEPEVLSVKSAHKSVSSRSRSLTSLLGSEIFELDDNLNENLSATKTKRQSQASSLSSQSLSSVSFTEELRKSARSKRYSDSVSLGDSGWSSTVSLVSDGGFDSVAFLAASNSSFPDEMPSLCGFDSFHSQFSQYQSSTDSLGGFYSASSNDLALASVDEKSIMEATDPSILIAADTSIQRPKLVRKKSPMLPPTRPNRVLQSKPIRSVLKVSSNEHQPDVRLLRDERWQTNRTRRT